MQKALVVRASAGTNGARSWSQAVDGQAGDRPLGELLAAGWRVANAFPMPGDLDSCCLVVLETAVAPVAAPAADLPLAALAPAARPAPAAPRAWDGETIPLTIFGVAGQQL